jgi:hypothetical protein
MSEIKISDINTEQFNPFSATEEELIANALDESGLIRNETLINDISAKEFCKLYFEKRENYKNSTKLGSLLVKNYVVTSTQLHKALEHQKKHPSMRLGDALVDLGFCTADEIEKCIDAQVQIRYDIKELDEFIYKINSLKERLQKYFDF